NPLGQRPLRGRDRLKSTQSRPRMRLSESSRRTRRTIRGISRGGARTRADPSADPQAMQKQFSKRLDASGRASCPEGGFTVVESMIAIGVLAVAAFSALATLNRSTALDETLRERSIALRAAMSKMESIAAYDYAD